MLFFPAQRVPSGAHIVLWQVKEKEREVSHPSPSVLGVLGIYSEPCVRSVGCWTTVGGWRGARDRWKHDSSLLLTRRERERERECYCMWRMNKASFWILEIQNLVEIFPLACEHVWMRLLSLFQQICSLQVSEISVLSCLSREWPMPMPLSCSRSLLLTICRSLVLIRSAGSVVLP